MKNNAAEVIKRLIRQLGNENGYLREKARKTLVKVGKPAVPMLVDLLSNPKPLLRWEACKALGSMKDPTTAENLVSVLNDESVEIRWLASEALISLKADALVPLLHSLKENFNSLYLRQSARQILNALGKDHLLNDETHELLNALRHFEPSISVAVAAHKVLNSFEKPQQKYSGIGELRGSKVQSTTR